jgi:ATP-dependent Lon protease
METGTQQQHRSFDRGAGELVLTAPEGPRLGRRKPETRIPEEVGPVHQLYSDSDLVQLRRSLRPDKSDSDSKIWELAKQLPPAPRLLSFGATPEQDFFKRLLDRFPHMREPIDLFADMAGLSIATNSGYQSPPILLEGPPGIGKTAFANALARAVGTKMEVLNMAGITAGFIISGSHASWSSGKQGRIFDLLTSTNASANPVVVLDELDKVGGDHRFDPCGSLYTLLEPSSARSFKDEFIPLPIDASTIIWIATCNRAVDIPSPLLSRFDAFAIEVPDSNAWAAIVRSIWSDLFASTPRWARMFSPTLADDVITMLVSLGDARDISRVLTRAVARAARAGRAVLVPDDVRASHPSNSRKRRPIGFV